MLFLLLGYLRTTISAGDEEEVRISSLNERGGGGAGLRVLGAGTGAEQDSPAALASPSDTPLAPAQDLGALPQEAIRDQTPK